MSATVPVVDTLPTDTGSRAVAQVQQQLAEQAASGGAGDGDVLAPSQGSQDVDLSAIRIPKSDKLPPHLLKYAGKDFSQISEILLNGERFVTSKAEEAASARREVAQLQARLAAAEQVNKMTAQPAAPAAAPERLADAIAKREGFTNAEEAYWKDPVGFTEKLEDARMERLRGVIAEETGKVKTDLQNQTLSERQQLAHQERLVATFEAAKEALAKQGYELDHDAWVRGLHYIIPMIERESAVDPSAWYNTQRYVEHFVNVAGSAQKPTIPQEGASAAGARPSGDVKTRDNKMVPTIDREERQKRKAIAETFVSQGHMTQEQAKAYIAGER